MRLNKLIEQFQQLCLQTENPKFKKSAKKIIIILEEIELKNISNEEKQDIQKTISPFFENIKTHKDLQFSMKKFRKSLTSEFGFVPPNYFLTLGVGVGIALGTSLGVSFGVPFDSGVVFGPMIGSGLGLISGLISGIFLDKKKHSENRILKNL